MKLGPRLAIVTTFIMATALGLAAATLFQVRRAELQGDVRGHFQEIAVALSVAMSPWKHTDDQAVERLRERARQLSRELHPIQVDVVAFPNEGEIDQGWGQLVEAATIDKGPAGRFFDPDDRPQFFAMAVPLFDGPRDLESSQIRAVVGLRRQTNDLDRAVNRTLRAALPVMGLGVAFFGLLVYVLLRRSVVRPLRRLNDAIDAVAKGDLSRALLPQSNDEIGVLAGRFNLMTESLREAHEAQARANTARTAMQMRLRHSEKLATVGQMAAQIAHEVGTPLNVIGGRARTMAKKAADATEVSKNAEIISGQVDRIAQIIRQVLHFSRKSRPTLTYVDLQAVANECLGFLWEGIEERHIQVAQNIPADLPVVPGNPGEIQQICLNLMNNAVHAMPDGGTLGIHIRVVKQRKGGLDLSAPSSFVMVEITDTGAGVPDELRERVFEPFFTTKVDGGGTGLGLAVAKGIVADHDGWMEVDNQPPQGAVFRFFLPLASEGADLGEGSHDLSITRP